MIRKETYNTFFTIVIIVALSTVFSYYCNNKQHDYVENRDIKSQRILSTLQNTSNAIDSVIDLSNKSLNRAKSMPTFITCDTTYLSGYSVEFIYLKDGFIISFGSDTNIVDTLKYVLKKGKAYLEDSDSLIYKGKVIGFFDYGEL